ncbi:MAG: putative bifunctional diguanylate cyclase/phosphodiesterase [Candidatus Coproplasma sp.]
MELDYTQIVYAGFDLCAIEINAIVLINYFMAKRMRTRPANAYAVLIVSALISSIINTCLVLSVTMFKDYCPMPVLYLLHMLYYVSLTATGLIFIFYTILQIYENRRIPLSAYVVMAVLAVLSFAMIAFYLAIWVNDYVNNVALMTIFRNLIFGCRMLVLVTAFIYVLVNVKSLRRAVKYNLFFFIGLNILAAVIQMIINRLQIVDFTLSIAVLLIYISLQRPEHLLDSTTGMFNTATYKSRFELLLNSRKSFIVLVTELNNMQLINATFGVTFGNELIRQVAEKLKENIGKEFYLYKLDGVKFAINFNDEQEIEAFAKKYDKIFDAPFVVENTPVRVSALACAIKCPEVTDKIADIDEVMKYYRVHASSEEGIITATRESIDKNRRYEKVDYAIQSALKNRAFKIFYQPIYETKTGKFNCCEALIRLIDPELGFIPPDEFIPIAEQNGRIVDIGRFVIEEVCRFITERKPQQYGLEFVDVNLSVIQCLHPEIIHDIDEILERYEVPRDMVSLEITETASAKSYGVLQTRLGELRSNGYTISLDDFGTGFSSVEFLINFPFDVVKLDKSLIWAYMSTKKYEPILQHYLPMLHGLGAKVVAEGVETAEMAEALKKLNCDYLQGFYYSRPVPEDEFVTFISRNSKNQIA